MSGIVGIFNLDGAPVDRELLRRMTASMAFRGPDAQEIWSDGPIGFGHTMLRTTFEAEHEHQPMTLDGQVWITADCRVDGRSDLIRELASHDRRVASDVPDPELILHAYHVWGEDCVKHLIGDFAFAIWDGRRRTLFCARDHFGIKPFYYAEIGNCLVFGNTLNCVRLHPAVSARLNEQAIGDFLLGLDQDEATSFFADVKRLPARSYLKSANAFARLEVRPYWDLPVNGRIRYGRKSDYVDKFRHLLSQAVSDRLRSRRIAISMSGGMDSTAIAAVAAEVASRTKPNIKIEAFTVVYDRLLRDEERHYSTLAAAALGLPIHHIPIDDYDLCEREGDVDMPMPEPTGNPLRAVGIDLLRRSAVHARVILGGEGGDPLFRGPRKPFDIVTLPKFALAVSHFAMMNGRFPSMGLRPMLRRYLDRNKPRPQPPFPQWLNPDFAKRLDLRGRWERFQAQRPQRLHPERPEAHAELRSGYWSRCLNAWDPECTGVPIESRYPLFDVRIVNYMLSIPSIPWCLGKGMLRVLMRGLLPDVVRLRKKTPLVGAPMLERLREGRPAVPATEMTPGDFSEYIDPQIAASFVPSAVSMTENEVGIHLRPVILSTWLSRANAMGRLAQPKPAA
ncbi:MAG TPA: asparagine synthase-related protein [Tepidisphaeraceae bacterium]|jgi:asparagine synthase (glutamine-hydrolysing)|nr:asparagine synthase-related protein [Tepidisphaeraceae bacterium]